MLLSLVGYYKIFQDLKISNLEPVGYKCTNFPNFYTPVFGKVPDDCSTFLAKIRKQSGKIFRGIFIGANWFFSETFGKKSSGTLNINFLFQERRYESFLCFELKTIPKS